MVLLVIALVAAVLVAAGLRDLTSVPQPDDNTPALSSSVREAELHLIVMRTELALITEFLRDLDAT